MRSIKTVLLVIVFLPLAMIQEQAYSQGVEGLWISTDEIGRERSIVKTFIENNKLYGKILKLLDEEEAKTNPICVKCEGKLKGHPIIGIQIINGLENVGREWYRENGILDPYTGKYHNVRIWVKGDELKVRGYKGFLYLTMTWKSVK